MLVLLYCSGRSRVHAMRMTQKGVDRRRVLMERYQVSRAAARGTDRHKQDTGRRNMARAVAG